MIALELQRRLTAAGSPIISTAAHPGYAKTNLQVTGPGEGNLTMRVLEFLLRPQDAAHGALPTLFAAVAPEATASGYTVLIGSWRVRGLPGTGEDCTGGEGRGRCETAVGGVGAADGCAL